MKPRPYYLSKLKGFRNPEIVKVLSGVRRSGKSSLLRLFKEECLKEGFSCEQIISINYEEQGVADLQAPQAFHAYLRAHIKSDKQHILLIDEVQELDEWAKHINSARASYNVDIYVTGSNSRMFSGEHLTYLSGRYIEIKIFPLSFVEYLSFRAKPQDEHTIKYLEEYLRDGSFPAIALTENTELKTAINEGLKDSIFERDVILRGRIKEPAKFYKVARFVCDNIGNQTSANAIANTLKSQGHSVSVDTVDSYLKLMCDAFLLYQCNRYNIRGREHLRTNGKYYIVDNALRSTFLGRRQSDFGHIIENAVFLQLLRLGNEVAVGRIGTAEIDFIASKNGEPAYYQVSQSVIDPAVLERELTPLRMIGDNYPKYLITMDETDYSKEGITHLNMLDFLRQQQQI